MEKSTKIAVGVGVAGALVALRANALSKRSQVPAQPAPLPINPESGKPELPEAYKPVPPPVVNMPDKARMNPPGDFTPKAPAKVVDKTTAGNPIIAIDPTSAPEAQVKFQGKAVETARTLYDYLKANGTKPTERLKAITLAFQLAHDADPNTNHLTGKLNEQGVYDARTASALTLYTGNPIPSDSNAPIGKSGGISPSAVTASDLYAYLRVRGNDKSAALKKLVLAFQKAANTDPLFPGPASPYVRIIKEKLKEDGIYGPKTADALKIMTFEPIKP